ncbi:hypothetical protein CR532_01815 [Candidatus Borreliella tachyglossi]|uniref:Uncharacterized protein n=1 Tax=Candidatus Borreliella tachyglossi TaxID=1964448 RepID=A0A2S1LWS4_9SPIR|nr:hypothetical protein [Candidatus Borreliella tachyglossi]AWG42738.1 hypothetical protein CR532_01815 [Candidatus Borreliella tachyglossi]
MLNVLRFIFLIAYRFIFVFFLLSLIFICIFYLRYKFLYVNFSIFSYDLYYNAYLYVFPLALVITFMRVSYPMDVELLGASRSLYFIIFVFILLLSYFGFLAAINFNSIFVGFQERDDKIIKDGVVHFFDDKITLYSKDARFFGFKGLLRVEHNDLDESDFKGFIYRPNFSKFNVIDSSEDKILAQRTHRKCMSVIFNDLDTLNTFLLSLGYFGLMFNILGFTLLLFSFSYVFNLIFSSSFSLFLYPIFVILFFKIYNLYAIEFPKNFNLIMGRNVISDYIPFIFCVLTFFSSYLFGFISEYVRLGEEFENSLR